MKTLENKHDFKVGDKVKFVDEESHYRCKRFYPPVGTVGCILYVCIDGDLLVQWPSGSTSRYDKWYCNKQDVVLVNEQEVQDG